MGQLNILMEVIECMKNPRNCPFKSDDEKLLHGGIQQRCKILKIKSNRIPIKVCKECQRNWAVHQANNLLETIENFKKRHGIPREPYVRPKQECIELDFNLESELVKGLEKLIACGYTINAITMVGFSKVLVVCIRS